MPRVLLALALLPVQFFITPPRCIYRPSPVYPPLAKQARIQGTVRFSVRVDENGTVDRIRLISGHPFLVKAAIDAVKQYEYLPATRAGMPIPMAIEVSVTFSLGLDRAPQQPRREQAPVHAA